MKVLAKTLFLFAISAFIFIGNVSDVAAEIKKGKRPIIIVPGILGSELINEATGETVWFKIGRSKDDDLRLPISLNLYRAKDNLMAGDIMRKIKVPIIRDIEVYEGIIEALKNEGGYEEASWTEPPNDLRDKFFIFPYDWRRDNVETAQLLIRKIKRLKSQTRPKNQKFDVIAHSMGGLITRYAAMYGDRDLSPGKPRPTWAGKRHFNKVFLVGTPNKGAADAFQTLLEGFGAIKNVNIPFVRDLSSAEVFTMPSLFQLIPHKGTERFFDENLKPLNVDIYNYKTWQKYGWSIYGLNEKLDKKYSEAEMGRFEAYLEVVLKRAKKFHEALNVRKSRRSGVEYFVVGSECSKTLDGFVIYKDAKKDRWITLTEPDTFKNSTGKKISGEQIRKLLLVSGDGRVTKRSLLAKSTLKTKRGNILSNSGKAKPKTFFVCERHDALTGNASIQKHIFPLLNQK